MLCCFFCPQVMEDGMVFTLAGCVITANCTFPYLVDWCCFSVILVLYSIIVFIDILKFYF